MKLEGAVSEVSKASLLERMLDDNTSSYKFYWLRGIVNEICKGNSEISYVRIVSRMISGCWFSVKYFRLSLGATDKLNALVDELAKVTGLSDNATEEEIIAAVENSYETDPNIRSMMNAICKYVPYRIIKPFYAETIKLKQAALRQKGVKRVDSYADGIIAEANNMHPENAFYVIWQNRKGLTVNSEWVRFVRCNEPVIRGWLDFRLTQYLQSRNPSVPAISMKLYAPVQRKLETAREYWKCAIGLIPIQDIYSGELFSEDAFHEYGTLSVDHFIPWSFVLHDEAWNLSPMFKNINSSKSDKLPQIEKYLDGFCQQQYEALMAIKDAGCSGSYRKQFDSYRSLDSNIDEYCKSDRSRDTFTATLRKTIVPLYQIALNQGFEVWSLS